MTADRLFFSADDGKHGSELWSSDGRRRGTVLVKDIAPQRGFYIGSSPHSLTVMGSQVFFSADDGSRGRELWATDGSRAGTVLVKNIDPVDARTRYGSLPTSLVAVGDQMFFAADDGIHGRELWKTDGTEAGTMLVKDIRTGSPG